MRRWFAKILCPDMAEKADRYDRIVSWTYSDMQWLAPEFPDAFDAMKRVLEIDRDYWRKINEPARNTLPSDISEFREMLRRRRVET